MCICPVAELIAYRIVTAVIVFGVSWLVGMGGFYGYHFFRALFHGSSMKPPIPPNQTMQPPARLANFL
jgi:hypothetical protein